MRWSEWHRHCDIVLGYHYHWPSDDTSGGSSASGPQ